MTQKSKTIHDLKLFQANNPSFIDAGLLI